jgi:hypothetical protein
MEAVQVHHVACVCGCVWCALSAGEYFSRKVTCATLNHFRENAKTLNHFRENAHTGGLCMEVSSAPSKQVSSAPSKQGRRHMGRASDESNKVNHFTR